MTRYAYTLIGAALILSLVAPTAGAQTGSGTVKVGYTYVDNQGNQGVNQESYNYYEGFGLSLNNWIYSLKNGATLAADLNNITLNNRVLFAALNRPGQYTLSVTNSQYRRVYDSAGNDFTRRTSTGAEARYQFGRNVKFSGGYAVTSKHGTEFEILSPIFDTVVTSTDYTQTGYHFGTELSCKHGTFRADWRHNNLDDKTTSNYDRKSDNINLVATSSVPRVNWLFLTAGYLYRIDKLDTFSTKVQTSQPWGAVKAYFPRGFFADYRFVYGMTKHTGPLQETDNILHVATVGKNWPRYGGVRLGGEYATSDNFLDKTSSKGFVASGWVRPTSQLNFNCALSTRKRTVDDGVVLTGDEDATRYSLSGKYTDTAWGSVSLKWEDRERENSDIDSKVQFSGLTPQLTVQRRNLGSFTATYSYYVGTYHDMSATTSYEFQDHILNGTLRSAERYGFVAEAGATYYRSKRDQDLQKSMLEFALSYRFLKNHHVEIRYNVFNYDDFLLVNHNGYTGNIVEVNLLKDITF